MGRLAEFVGKYKAKLAIGSLVATTTIAGVECTGNVLLKNANNSLVDEYSALLIASLRQNAKSCVDQTNVLDQEVQGFDRLLTVQKLSSCNSRKVPVTEAKNAEALCKSTRHSVYRYPEQFPQEEIDALDDAWTRIGTITVRVGEMSQKCLELQRDMFQKDDSEIDPGIILGLVDLGKPMNDAYKPNLKLKGKPTGHSLSL